MKKITLTALLLAGVLCLPALKAESNELEAKKAITGELMHVMRVKDSMEMTLAAVKKMQITNFKNMNIPEEQKDKAIKLQKKIMDLVTGELSWDNLKNDFIVLYAKTFSQDELNAMLDFYKSPLGQKILDKTPELTQKTMSVIQAKMKIIMPQIQKMSEEMRSQE